MSRRAIVAAVAASLVPLAACASSQYPPECNSPERDFVLVAQSVPSAQLLPCIAEMPAGWGFFGSQTRSSLFRFELSSDRAGTRAVEVTLTESCDTSNAVEVAPGPDEAGTRRFEEPISLPPRFAANRYYTFPGGCVTYEFRFEPGASPGAALEADGALSFRPRAPIVAHAAEQGLVLCGAGAPACPGGD